jgi:hypothetical protein
LRLTISKTPAMLKRLGNIKRGHPRKPDPERLANCNQALAILRAALSDSLLR